MSKSFNTAHKEQLSPQWYMLFPTVQWVTDFSDTNHYLDQRVILRIIFNNIPYNQEKALGMIFKMFKISHILCGLRLKPQH